MRRNGKPTVGLAFLATLVVVDSALGYYDPRTGRFLSREPIGEPGFVLAHNAGATTPFIPRDPIAPARGVRAGGFVLLGSRGEDEPHTYRAVRNNPLAWIDPDGAMSISVSPCDPQYPPPNPPPGATYDCVGLACRTYTSGQSAEPMLEGFRVGSTSNIRCNPCEIKCWVWIWDEWLVRDGKQISYPAENSHIVCGQVGCIGQEPKCYNKMFTTGALEGPADCESFKPKVPQDVPYPGQPGISIHRSEIKATYYYCGPATAVPGLKKKS